MSDVVSSTVGGPRTVAATPRQLVDSLIHQSFIGARRRLSISFISTSHGRALAAYASHTSQTGY